MKARVKATGKLLENVIPVMSVDSKIIMFHEYGTEDEYYYYEDLDFSNIIDWEQARIQLIGSALTGLLANPDTILNRESIVEVIFKIVDTLIEELKKGRQDVFSEARKLAAIDTAAVCENMTQIQKELQNIRRS